MKRKNKIENAQFDRKEISYVAFFVTLFSHKSVIKTNCSRHFRLWTLVEKIYTMLLQLIQSKRPPKHRISLFFDGGKSKCLLHTTPCACPKPSLLDPPQSHTCVNKGPLDLNMQHYISSPLNNNYSSLLDNRLIKRDLTCNATVYTNSYKNNFNPFTCGDKAHNGIS